MAMETRNEQDNTVQLSPELVAMLTSDSVSGAPTVEAKWWKCCGVDEKKDSLKSNQEIVRLSLSNRSYCLLVDLNQSIAPSSMAIDPSLMQTVNTHPNFLEHGRSRMAA